MVTMAGVRCAIPSHRVLRVLRRVTINTFPAREPAFLGLARYSNDAVAVLDGGMLFGLRERPGPPAAEPVVVMVDGGKEGASEPFGLLVEGADRIVTPVGEEGDWPPEGTVICDPEGLTPGHVREEP